MGVSCMTGHETQEIVIARAIRRACCWHSYGSVAMRRKLARKLLHASVAHTCGGEGFLLDIASLRIALWSRIPSLRRQRPALCCNVILRRQSHTFRTCILGQGSCRACTAVQEQAHQRNQINEQQKYATTRSLTKLKPKRCICTRASFQHIVQGCRHAIARLCTLRGH